jgi:hypothetical protein
MSVSLVLKTLLEYGVGMNKPKVDNLRCCVLSVSIRPIKMGNSKKSEKPLAQCIIPLGWIDPKEAYYILQDYMQ